MAQWYRSLKLIGAPLVDACSLIQRLPAVPLYYYRSFVLVRRFYCCKALPALAYLRLRLTARPWTHHIFSLPPPRNCSACAPTAASLSSPSIAEVAFENGPCLDHINCRRRRLIDYINLLSTKLARPTGLVSNQFLTALIGLRPNTRRNLTPSRSRETSHSLSGVFQHHRIQNPGLRLFLSTRRPLLPTSVQQKTSLSPSPRLQRR